MSSNPHTFRTLDGSNPPLVAGSGSSTLISASDNISFEPYNQGYEAISFTLEAWFMPMTNTGEVVVLGHTGEGVLWNGTDFILRIKQDAGTVETSWTPNNSKSFYVAMIYRPTQAELYIDATLVASLDLLLSPFTSTSGSIRINGGTGSAIYDSVALYARGLSAREVGQHYEWGKAVRAPEQTASANGATTWTLMNRDSDIYSTVVFDYTNWDQFFTSGVGIMGTRMIANDGGGTWMGMVPVSSMISDTIAGVSLTYQGFKAVLSYSTDNITWTPVMNGAIVLEDATDVNLLLRFDLPEEGWVDSLTVLILNDRLITPTSGSRNLAFKSVLMDYETPNPLDYLSTWGAVIRNGYLEIQQDEANTIGTVEMWAKLDDNSGFFIGNTGTSYVKVDGGNVSAVGMTAYRNGQPFTSATAQQLDQWAHWIFVLTTPNDSKFRIGGNLTGTEMLDVTVGHLATYDYEMTAAQALNLYKSNVGSPILRVNDSSGVNVTESSSPVSFYAQTWSFIPGQS